MSMPMAHKAIAIQFPVIERIAGLDVTYAPADAGIEPQTIKAVRGRRDSDLETEEQFSIHSGSMTWIVRVQTFEAAFGSGARPNPGDRITHGDDKFELIRQPEGDVWHYVDPGQTAMRVHTMRRGDE